MDGTIRAANIHAPTIRSKDLGSAGFRFVCCGTDMAKASETLCLVQDEIFFMDVSVHLECLECKKYLKTTEDYETRNWTWPKDIKWLS